MLHGGSSEVGGCRHPYSVPSRALIGHWLVRHSLRSAVMFPHGFRVWVFVLFEPMCGLLSCSGYWLMGLCRMAYKVFSFFSNIAAPTFSRHSGFGCFCFKIFGVSGRPTLSLYCLHLNDRWSGPGESTIVQRAAQDRLSGWPLPPHCQPMAGFKVAVQFL